jgi:hypothetical protein
MLTTYLQQRGAITPIKHAIHAAGHTVNVMTDFTCWLCRIQHSLGSVSMRPQTTVWWARAQRGAALDMQQLPMSTPLYSTLPKRIAASEKYVHYIARPEPDYSLPTTLRSTPANNLAVSTGAVDSCCPKLRSSSLVKRSVDLTSCTKVSQPMKAAHATPSEVLTRSERRERARARGMQCEDTVLLHPPPPTTTTTHPPIHSPAQHCREHILPESSLVCP